MTQITHSIFDVRHAFYPMISTANEAHDAHDAVFYISAQRARTREDLKEICVMRVMFVMVNINDLTF